MDSVDIKCMIFVIIVIIGVSIPMYYGPIWFEGLPLERQCGKNYLSYENNKTIITYNTYCVKYFTNEKGYYIDQFSTPSLGSDGYLLRKS